MYDYENPRPSLEELKRAAAEIKHNRELDWDAGRGWAGYDYIPETTLEEAWNKVEQDKYWSDHR